MFLFRDSRSLDIVLAKCIHKQFIVAERMICFYSILDPNVNPALSIPDSSQYLAVDFSVKPFDIPANDLPIALVKEEFGTLWYFRNQQTLPKGFVYSFFFAISTFSID